jgi:hypothetical protein
MNKLFFGFQCGSCGFRWNGGGECPQCVALRAGMFVGQQQDPGNLHLSYQCGNCGFRWNGSDKCPRCFPTESYSQEYQEYYQVPPKYPASIPITAEEQAERDRRGIPKEYHGIPSSVPGAYTPPK